MIMGIFRLIKVALVTILISMTACSDGKDELDTSSPYQPSEITIDTSIITNGVAFAATGGEKFVNFSSNTDWTLSIASTTGGSIWCTASATSGSKGETTIKFTTTENTEYEDRSVAVTIKAGTASKTFTITQKCKDAMLLTSDKFEVSQKGGSIEVEVKANINYQMEISETAKNWITQVNTRALTARKHTFNIAANEEYDKREGEIYFINGEQKEVVKVYQTGGAVIMLTKNDYAVSDKGETITVEIKSNFKYGVKMPNVDWISDVSTRGASSHTLKYVVSPNETYDSRSAQIIYYDENNIKNADTLTVIQAQKDAIIISKKEYEASVKGEVIEVELASNIDYAITIDKDGKEWISQVESKVTRALTNKKLYFKIATNNSDKERIGRITISNEKGINETITITQEKPLFDFVSEPIINVLYKEETIEVQFNTNIDYTVHIADDGKSWIEKIKDDIDKLTHKTYFRITENKETDSRSSKITFTANSVDYIVEIKQEGVFNGVIEVKQAGTLPTLLTEKSDTITTLKIIGDLNGTDIAFLRYMTGGTSKLNKKGKLKYLDLLDANIVSGGEPYYSIYHSAGHASTSELFWTKNNELHDYSFYGCSSLISLKLPKSLTKIGMDAFNGCKLESITVPSSVVCYNGGFIFKGCNIKDIHITDLSLWNESLNFSFPSDGWNLHINGRLATQISIPNGTAQIRASAFRGCVSLTNVVLPNSVTTIENNAFTHCTKLEKINIPDNVATIGYRAFMDTKLASIDIPDGTRTIDAFAFYGCPELEKVNIVNGVTSIGTSAFEKCRKIQKIVIPNSVNTIGEHAFAQCTNLTSIVIGNGLKIIPEYLCHKCGNLVDVTIGSNVNYFGEYSFFTTPTSSTIKELHTLIKTPEKISCPPLYSEKVFGYTIQDLCTLYVPKGYKSTYEKCLFWKDFKNIIEE